MKTCTRCGIEKPLEDYHRNSRRGDGRQSRCKACISQYDRFEHKKDKERRAATTREWWRRNREERLAKYRAWYEANQERERVRSNSYARQHPEKVAAASARRRARKLAAPTVVACHHCNASKGDRTVVAAAGRKG